MTTKPKSLSPLEEANKKIQELENTLEVSRQLRRESDASLQDARKHLKEVEDQFDNLKSRLLESETACEKMRGYILRVQEDDIAREELVLVGNPNGEQRYVPKRKPHRFEVSSYEKHSTAADFPEFDQPKLKSWVNY